MRQRAASSSRFVADDDVRTSITCYDESTANKAARNRVVRITPLVPPMMNSTASASPREAGWLQAAREFRKQCWRVCSIA